MGLLLSSQEYHSLPQSPTNSEPPSPSIATRDCLGTTEGSMPVYRTNASSFTRTNLQLGLISKIIWKGVLVLMSLFFLAAAYVQHNDPDPYLWIPVYLVPMFVNSFLVVSFPPTKIVASSREKTVSFQIKNGKDMRRHRRCALLSNWNCINKVSVIHMGYCYFLGFWTMAHFIHRQMWSEAKQDYLLVSTIESFVSEPGMDLEEAKELLGLCLVIAWLSFVNNGNFLRFGRRGIALGFGLAATPIMAWVIIEMLKDETNLQECFLK